MPRAHARDSEGPCSKRMSPPEMSQYNTSIQHCKLAIDGRLTIESAMPATSPFSSSICPGRWRAGAPRTAVGRVFRFFGHGQRALLGADVSSVLMKREALGPHSAAAPGRRLKRLSDRHRALCPALLSKIHSDRLQILLSWNFSAPSARDATTPRDATFARQARRKFV